MLTKVLKLLGNRFWRLNNLYHIIDKNDNLIILKLNTAQKQLFSEKHPRTIVPKSRQRGISTYKVAESLDKCLFIDNTQAGIQSYGLVETKKLYRKAIIMWNNLDPDIKDLLGIKLVSSNAEGMFFSNGSVLRIGNFRGDTLSSLHVSELAKIAKKFPEKARELKTGAFQAVSKDNCISIESTAEGASGLFYSMCMQAKALQDVKAKLTSLDFKLIFLGWTDDPDCTLAIEPTIVDRQKTLIEKLPTYFLDIEKKLNIKLTQEQKNWYIAKYIELGEDIKQEYPATLEEAFEQNIEGAYYGNEFRTLNVKSNIYDPNLLVHSAIDFGMNDTFSIGFFQYGLDNLPRIIAEYENSGQGLAFYREIYLKLQEKFGWTFGKTYVPHDVKVRELIAAKSRWVALRELGFDPVLVKKHSILDGIEETRRFLRQVIIDASCKNLITAIQMYRKKRDEKYGVFLSQPVHDEFSHPADMLRYMAMGTKNNIPHSLIRENNNRYITKGFDI